MTKNKKRCIVFFVSISLSLLAIELFCRAAYPESTNARFTQLEKYLNKSKRFNSLVDVIENDEELFWKLKPSSTLVDSMGSYKGIIANAQGLREDHEIKKKEDNEVRILFLGDSCTFGYNLKHDQGFVDLTEKKLAIQFSKLKIECINAGVPGYSLFQGKKFLETKGLNYTPDAIVLNFGWNDQNNWDNRSDTDHYQSIKNSQPPNIFSYSRFFRLLWSHNTSSTTNANTPRLSPDQFAQQLRDIINLCAEKNIKLFVLVWPFDYNIDKNKNPKTRGDWQIAQYHFEKQTTLIDLVPVVQSLSNNKQNPHTLKDIFIDTGHATAFTNEQFSTQIYTALASWIKLKLTNS